MTLPSLSHDWPPEDLPASTTAPAPLPDPAEPSRWVRTLLAGLERRRARWRSSTTTTRASSP